MSVPAKEEIYQLPKLTDESIHNREQLAREVIDRAVEHCGELGFKIYLNSSIVKSRNLRFIAIKVALLFLFTVTAFAIPMPPSGIKMQSPRGTEQFSGVKMVKQRMASRAVAPPRTYSWTWDLLDSENSKLPMPDERVGFVVEATTDFVTWTEIGRLDAPPLIVSADKPKAFFRLRMYWK